MKKKVKWGKTPWDDLSKEELLREVQRMYAALESAHSVMALSGAKNGDIDGFWSKEGSGGQAFMESEEIIKPIEREYDSESLYRMFFRYARCLLFNYYEAKDRWVICPKCGQMLAGQIDKGKKCKDKLGGNCTGSFRYFKWEDFNL